MFNFMWRYAYNLRGIYETPSLADHLSDRNLRREKINKMLDSARQHGRTILTEVESKQVLSFAGIATVPTQAAHTESEAEQCADEIGFPVVLKVYSETITHKTDVGGVKLNLSNKDAVRAAYQAIRASVAEKADAAQFQGVTVQPMIGAEGYELILGSSIDPQFGPVILFGSGGQLVEVYRDKALALPPLNSTLAQRLMEQTRIYKALQGARGRAAIDLPSLECTLVRFSELVLEQPRIKEIDINPLLASSDRILALDARIVLHGPETVAEQLPRPAIRPYPVEYISRWKIKDGTEVIIRPIRPEDEPLMIRFHESLSERSVFLRYFHMENVNSRVAHDRLIQKCFIDYDREMALVADHEYPTTGQHELLAVARLAKDLSRQEGEVAVLVADAWQKQGLGTELMRRLIQFARAEKLRRVIANILPENDSMRSLGDRLGFTIQMTNDPSVLMAVLELR